MLDCSQCGVEMPGSARFCPSCGRPAATTPETRTAEVGYGYGTPAVAARSDASVAFVPGAVLAGRYRIVAMLGRGGMGEVYRADDLQLGHPVALKFLSDLSPDPSVLERFHAEVRLARQVSHPHVCRVYDISQYEGRPFLTMEYVDGEDLASLLRRIGRLPPDKALEIARQLCAGLAAAHDAGILHRDLKPSNILIDGRGRVRLTDFGLALRADHAAKLGEFAGTPSYMAPEQLREGTHAARSDLYSLGMVLYEVFTGRCPFEATTLGDWTRAHLYTEPTPPSARGCAIDPVVERVIMRCLQKEPGLRPASALHVLAALPGGDPLAVALAAGETPSPEIVAAAGERAGIRPRAAAALFAAVLVLLALVVPLARKGTLLGIAPLAKSPDAFTERAQQIVTGLGYDPQPADKVLWIRRDMEFLRHWFRQGAPAEVRELHTAWPGPYQIMYRQSPASLATREGTPIGETNPPPIKPGMVMAVLNNAGQLMRFEAVPPARDEEAGDPAAPDWGPLLAEAGLVRAELEPEAPLLIPRGAFDARAAWKVTRQGARVHVDAAAFRGKPVFLALTMPWSGRGDPRNAAGRAVGMVFDLVLFVVLPLAAGWMTRRNIRAGRGDLSGARRVALLVGVLFLLGVVTSLQPPNVARPIAALLSATSYGLFAAALAWMSYVALEPQVRRRAPHLLIAWTRLLAGRVTDPLVSRDVLIGVALGLLIGVLALAMAALPWWLAVAGIMPVSFSPRGVGSPNEFVSLLFDSGFLAVLGTLLLLFLYTGLLWLLRRRWLAGGTVLAVLAAVSLLGENAVVAAVPYALLTAAITLVALLRFGPVTVIAMLLVSGVLSAPVDLNMATWYAGRSALVLALIAGLAATAFHYAVGGRRLLPSDDEER